MAKRTFEAPLTPYRGYEIQVYKSNQYNDWGYKVFMVNGPHKKAIHHSPRYYDGPEVAMLRAKAYIDEFGEERMKQGYVFKGVRYYPQPVQQ